MVFFIREAGIQNNRHRFRLWLNKARPQHRNTERAGAIFLIGDLIRLPLRDSVLGGYISLGVVEHFRFREERYGALLEVTRSLVPGGRAFFACHGPLVCLRNNLSSVMTGGKIGIYHRYISRSSMEKLLRSGNMRVLKSKYEMGWIGLNNIIDGIIKRVGSIRLREKSFFLWSNLRPVWFFSGSHFWTEKCLNKASLREN